MRQIICIAILMVTLMSGAAFGAATVFFKDGTKEVGNSVWIEGSSVYLSKAKESYEFSADEVLMDDTQKFNKIGKFANISMPDYQKSSTANPRSNDLIDQLMAGLSFDRQIDQLIEQFSVGAQSSAGANSELSEVLAQALSGFDGKKAKLKIRSYYLSHLDNKTLEAILAWTKSPLGMKIREVETTRAVKSPEMAQQILNDQGDDSSSAQRKTLIRQLDKSGQATEMAMQMVVDAMSGAIGAIPAKNSEQKLARKEIEKQITLKKAEIVPELRKMVQASLFYVYRDLTDDELMDYIKFLQTEPAREFTKATMGAFSEMTKAMSASMIKNVVKAVDQKKRSKQI